MASTASKRGKTDLNSNSLTLRTPPKKQKVSSELATSFLIDQLPVELLEVILARVTSAKDLVSLSLTSMNMAKRLWESPNFWPSVCERLGLRKKEWGPKDFCVKCSYKPMFDSYLDFFSAMRHDQALVAQQ